MIEVEFKVPVRDRCLLEENLETQGFSKGNLVKETDLYFDNEHNQIKDSDGALRVRSCINLSVNTVEHFMTYKGPKMDAVSMSRKELEVQIDDADKGKEILTSLGYCKVYPVAKTRQYYIGGEITACLDQVEGLGEFLELEMIVSDEAEKPQALERLAALLRQLGYDPEGTIRRSYLSMLQQ